MTKEKDRLGTFLVNENYITKEELYEALAEQKKSNERLGQILISKGVLSQEQLITALAKQFDLERIHLSKVEVDSSLLSVFSPETMREWKVFPVKLQGDNLTVAVVNPLDIRLLQDLKYLSGYRIKPVLATTQEINRAINKALEPVTNFQNAIEDLVTSSDVERAEEDIPLKDLQVAAKEAPVVRMVDSIISQAVRERASDIHIEPHKDKVQVRYRIDGILYEKVQIPKGLHAPVVSRIKIMSSIDIAERRKPQDGRIGVKLGSSEYDLRVSTLPDMAGEKIVMRILDKQSVIVDLVKLGLDDYEKNKLENIITQPYGMLLVTGPTGSGKTTTLYSILNRLNSPQVNIVTVEDPVEYEIEGINQTEVNLRAGYSFATGMRHILRQDPDIILIGEIRDLETAEISIQAALTGHLVFSTLHTNDAPGTIYRLLNMRVEPFLISSSLIGVIAQRLVRKICPVCAEEYSPSEEVKSIISRYVSGPLEDARLLKAKGCGECKGRGYQGRLGIFEIMENTSQLKDLILSGAPESQIVKKAVKQGMRFLQTSGMLKALNKVTTLEEIMRVAFVKKGLEDTGEE